MKARERWKQIQGIIGTTQDGVPGKNDEAALLQLKAAARANLPEEHDGPITGLPEGEVDARSEKNIATLLPEVQPLARKLIHAAAAKGIKIIVTSGSRTYAEQDALYAQGRTKPGKVVTKAKGGQSNHNFGVAFDVTVFNDLVPVWETPHYKTVGALGVKLGLEWGGNWSSIVDEPHFQYNPRGYTTAQMRERAASGKSVLL